MNLEGKIRTLETVYNNIFDYAKYYLKNKSEYNPTIVKSTPEQSDVFPLVVISKFDDYLKSENLNKTGKKDIVVFEINIYSNDNENVHKEEIIEELEKLVNEIFEDKFGLTRKVNREKPNIDLSVLRQYMRYDGIYDEELNKLFRR